MGEKTVVFVLQVLALPGFVWKQLSGEEVSWSKDFPAVDSVLVSRFCSLCFLCSLLLPKTFLNFFSYHIYAPYLTLSIPVVSTAVYSGDLSSCLSSSAQR